MNTSGIPLPDSKTRTLAPRLVSMLRILTLIEESFHPGGLFLYPVQAATGSPSAYTTSGCHLSTRATCCGGVALLSRRIACWSGVSSSLACCPHEGGRKCDQRAV